MSSLNTVVEEITPFFPETPTGVLSWALMKAVRRFAADTSALQETFTFEAQECLMEYLVIPPECATITSIISVQRDSGCQKVEDLRWKFEVVNPVILLRDEQKAGTSVTVTYAYAPKGMECEMPDNIYPRYEDELLHLVRYNLYMMDDAEWSNPKRGEHHLKEYEGVVKRIAAKIRNQGRNGPRRMIGANFLGTSRMFTKGF